MATFDVIQTFYVDPEIVDNVSEVMLSSIVLYFETKPADTNITGTQKPAVVLSLCDVINDVPLPETPLRNSLVRKEYDSIYAVTNAQGETVFSFENPVVVSTGRFYGIVVKYEDPAYKLWVNKQGDKLMDISGPTNIASPGSQSRFDGKYYQINNSGIFSSYSDRDLKFKVNIAKFRTINKTISLVNKEYEFFSISTREGAFLGGEFIYQNSSNSTGTVNVSSESRILTGVGTTFSDYNSEQYVVVSNGSLTEVIKIASVTNNTNIELDRYPNFSSNSIGYQVPVVGRMYFADYTANKLVLVDSIATNSTFCFGTGNTIIGQRSGASCTISSIDNYSVDSFTPYFNIGNPATSNVAITYRLSNAEGDITSTPWAELSVNQPNEIRDYDGYVLSRSNEVVESTLFGSRKKSAVANVNITFNAETDSYIVPYIRGDELDFFTYQNFINNTYIDTKISIFDGSNVDSDTDFFTITGHQFRNGELVKYYTDNTTTGITGLANGGNYYVVSSNTSGIKVLPTTSLSNTAAVVDVTTGSGTGHFFETVDTFDSEITNTGKAISKYISKTINFAKGSLSEDALAFINAYKPVGTDIRVYVKIHNINDTEPFDDKSWTPLELRENIDRYSSLGNQYDFIEYGYGLQKYPEVLLNLNGSFNTTVNSAVITTSTDQSPLLSNGDIVRIYDPLTDSVNYDVFVVQTSNTTAITLNKPVTNNNIIGSIAVDKLKYRTTAFNNSLNDNIVRYFRDDGAEFDNFTSMKVKVVLLSNSTYVVPKLDTVQVLGVSA
jgi:hypothetical protein